MLDSARLRAFFRALASTGTGDLAAWLQSNRVDDGFVTFLERQGLKHYLFYRLQEARLLGALSHDVRDRLFSGYTRAMQLVGRHRREQSQVLDRLARRGLAPVVLKGLALAYTVYPDPACRPMTDLDLWLRGDGVPAAVAALEEAGYTYQPEYNRPIPLLRHQRGRIHLNGSPPLGGLIELHWSPFPGEWICRTTAIDEAGIMARCRLILIDREPVRVLAAEDTLIHLALHMAILHQMADPWLRGLLDIALLVRRVQINWDLVVDRARSWRVATATWLVIQLAQELFGLDEAAEALARLAPSGTQRRLIGLMTGPEAIIEQRDLTHGHLRFGLLLALVDRRADAAQFVARGLWPEEDWLVARYGQAGLPRHWQHIRAALRGEP